MAGVLYALYPELDQPSPQRDLSSETVDTLQDVVAAMSEAEVKELIAEAQSNSALDDYIRNLHGAHGVDLASLKREVSNIKRRHADRYGFIEYYHATGYATELERFMDKYISLPCFKKVTIRLLSNWFVIFIAA